MPIHTLTLIEKNEVARNTFVLHFEKPPGFTFKPGQYGGFTIINPSETDSGGNTRRFSLLGSPNDNDITLITRFQTSAYKRNLMALQVGDPIKFAGPTGIFTLKDDATIPAVFIAGGIGIAPFYSMIKFATEQQSTQPLYLFYGNSMRENTALLDELEELARQNPHFHLISIMVTPDDQWQGETGYINHTMIKQYIPDIMVPHFYICGSPTMVTALQETLAEMGINEDNVFVEDFPGY